MAKTKLKIGQGDWVVVCDGTKALLLQNVGDEKFLNLKTKQVYEQDDPRTSEQGTDVPGRAFASVGNVHSAVEQTDWHAQAEKVFLEKLASRLDHAVKDGEMRHFIMIAPPRALGVLRRSYSHGVRDALRGELDKDLVKHPVSEIEKYLTA